MSPAKRPGKAPATPSGAAAPTALDRARAAYEERQRAAGMLVRSYRATAKEHEALRAYLARLRSK